MIHVGKERVYNTLDAAHEPAATVAPGSVVEIETQLNGGDWLHGVEDLWDPSKSRGPNLTTVVAVESAHPGDTLVVEVLDVVPGPLGYTGFAGWRNPLSQLIWENDWDVVTKTVRIEDGRVLWSDGLSLPVRPMIGTIATAPAGISPSPMRA